ncbi:hypothetical protein [Shimia sagamensis]|nr:hypothetical protein [Shimia sagamensis]
MSKHKTQMAPLAATIMLGHSMELLAKAYLLIQGDVTVDQLKGWGPKNENNKVRYGHNIKNMWRAETPLFDQAEELWFREYRSHYETRDDCMEAFERIFNLAAEHHEAPYSGRYGGKNRYPAHEKLAPILSEILEHISKSH